MPVALKYKCQTACRVIYLWWKVKRQRKTDICNGRQFLGISPDTKAFKADVFPASVEWTDRKMDT